MPALIAFLADLLKLPPAAVGATLVVVGVVLVVMLLTVSIRHGFHYLERRDENKLIAKLIEKSTPDAVVIQAIRGTAIAGAATTSSDSEVVDAEVTGLARRLTGWMRELKLPGG